MKRTEVEKYLSERLCKADRYGNFTVKGKTWVRVKPQDLSLRFEYRTGIDLYGYMEYSWHSISLGRTFYYKDMDSETLEWGISRLLKIAQR